ncbi:MAG: hypothetical protein WAL75_03015 [Terracidiphilus sp.]
MKTRPPTITLLSFLFIAVGVISTAAHVWQFNIEKPSALEEAGIFVIGALAVLAGVYMLRGKNWARWLALAWISFHVIVAAFNQPLGLIIHVVFVVLLAWLLFRRESQQWFNPRPEAAPLKPPSDPPPPVS